MARLRRVDPFVLLCRAHGLPEPETEVVFAPPRKFRADYLWRDARLIVEKNGGIWRKGGHSSGRGLLRDYEKLNLAQVLGWRYLVYTPAQLSSGEAIQDLQAVFAARPGRRPPPATNQGQRNEV